MHQMNLVTKNVLSQKFGFKLVLPNEKKKEKQKKTYKISDVLFFCPSSVLSDISITVPSIISFSSATYTQHINFSVNTCQIFFIQNQRFSRNYSVTRLLGKNNGKEKNLYKFANIYIYIFIYNEIFLHNLRNKYFHSICSFFTLLKQVCDCSFVFFF